MAKETFLITESVSTTLYVWIDPANNKITTIDSGDRAKGGYHVHHTDFIKQRPSAFGLEPEDVMDANDVRDERLLQTVINKGFVRGVIDPEEATVGLEANSLKSVYKAVRMLMKNFHFQPMKLMADIESAHQHISLAGQKLEMFLKTGNISNSRLMFEGVSKLEVGNNSLVINVDPSAKQVIQLIENNPHKVMRGLVFKEKARGRMILWDASKAYHVSVAQSLGLPDDNNIWQGFFVGTDWTTVEMSAGYDPDRSEFTMGNGLAVLANPNAFPLFKTSSAYCAMMGIK